MVVANIEEQIKMLVELQELDSVIFSKKRILETVPKRMEELDAALQEKTGKLSALEEEQKKLQLEQKEKESDLAAKETGIKKYQAQLFQVKTNKEYTALEKEIAGIKADNSILEEKIIELLDGVEEIRKKISTEKEVLEAEKAKVSEEKKKIEAERKAAEEEFNGLFARREGFTVNIDKNILSRYERILHNKVGLAMVPVVGGSCGGCNMNLPAQVVNETRLRKDFTFCGNCARILYWKD